MGTGQGGTVAGGSSKPWWWLRSLWGHLVTAFQMLWQHLPGRNYLEPSALASVRGPWLTLPKRRHRRPSASSRGPASGQG